MRYLNNMCFAVIAAALMLTGGCSSAYYGTMEKLGIHKRDIMVDRVSEARDEQKETVKEFQSALEQFTTLVQVEGGDLEKKYKRLDTAYKSSKDQADTVHARIAAVESVSVALFREWEDELSQYGNQTLRRDSELKLRETRHQYDKLIDAMKRAEDKINPVLQVFHDQVLYLKHNLNARAIASLQGELVTMENDVAKLVREMEASIREADQFISTLREN